ncbi:unnamed protein product [Effrenium voratum]|nr:unnamed protein product [Effrenium voratum]
MKSPESEGRADAELTVSSFLDRGGEVAEMLRSRAIMEMLVERCEMEKASESDGASSLAPRRCSSNMLHGGRWTVFVKGCLGSEGQSQPYAKINTEASCRFVWMEMLQKLLAVGLVTAISTEDAFHLSLAFVLGMAATIAMVQPYIQPQMNELHFFSLLSLAAAAVGFAGAGNPKAQFPHWLWLSRVSVLLPFLLAAGQALRPDSCEALAMRLFQEARQQLEVLQKGQEVELVVKTVSFI